MKTRAFVLTIILLIAVPLSFADDKITIDDIYGTWVNEDYNEKSLAAVIILSSDGTAVGYDKETDTKPDWTFQYTITESWYDNEGNLWIKREGISVYAEQIFQKHWLEKYSNDGTVYECVWSEVDYPTEMSPVGGNYIIYYRH